MNQQKMTIRYFWVTLLNVIITIAEFIGGAVSGSLALLSDAIHNLGDVGAIILGFFAQLIGERERDRNKTFGYKRAETLAAFTNGIILIIISIFLMVEAVQRFLHPTPIAGGLMLIVSIIGLFGNAVSMLAMRKGTDASLNVKATFLHMLADALSSVVVIIGGIFIYFWHVNWLDPVLTLVVSLFVLKEAYTVVKQATNILMEANPNINLNQVNEIVLSYPQVEGIHHVHVWRYSEHMIMLDAHINVAGDTKVVDLEKLYQEICSELGQKLHINHVTLQAEAKRGYGEKMIAPTKDD